ncbi:MAG: hypothetical protein ACK5OW_01750 [bacterium]
MKELYLIYINKVGTNHKGEHIFEFLFSNSVNYDWDETWYESSVVTDKNDLTPDPSFIKFVGNIKTSDFDLELIQNSGVFQIYNAVEGIVALGWEKLEDNGDYPEERLVFKFGDTLKSVEEKLYSLDLVFDKDKKIKT